MKILNLSILGVQASRGHGQDARRSEKRKATAKSTLGLEQLDQRRVLTSPFAVYEYPEANPTYDSAGWSYGNTSSSFWEYGSSSSGPGSSFMSYGPSGGGYGSSFGVLGAASDSLWSMYGADRSTTTSAWQSGSTIVGKRADGTYVGGWGTGSTIGASAFSPVINQTQSDDLWNSFTSSFEVYGKVSAKVSAGTFEKGGSLSWGTNGLQMDVNNGYKNLSGGAGSGGLQGGFGGDLNVGPVVVSGSVTVAQKGRLSGEVCVGVGQSRSLPKAGKATVTGQICASPKSSFTVTPFPAPKTNSAGYPVIHKSRKW